MQTKNLLTLAVIASLAVPAIARAEVVIGAIGPLTGGLAAYGGQLKSGVEAAAEAINAKGGILGQTIRVELADSQGDPRQGVSVAHRFAGQGVRFVVGPVLSTISIPASEIFAESGTLTITPSATIPAYTDRGLWNTFRTCGRDDQQAVVAGDYLLKNLVSKRVAIVHDKSTYGKGLADGVRTVINAGGLKEVLYEAINPGEKNYNALVSRLKAANIEVLYYGGYHTEAGLIIRQMRDQNEPAVLMGGDGLASSEFWAIAGPGGAGTLMTNSPDPSKEPSAAQVVADLRSKNIPPETFTLNSYAAMQLIKQGTEKAGSLDARKVAEALKSGAVYPTVIGQLAYDNKGDVKGTNFVVFRWADGSYTELR